MSKSKTRVAVIGHGHLGKWHAEKAQKLADLVGIVEVNDKIREQVQKKYPDLKVCKNIDDIIDDIDAGIVVTPTFTHFDVVSKLLENEKHVFCEKPLCSHENEANDIIALANKNPKLVVQVGHSERFHESWELIEKYEKYLRSPCLIRMNRFAPFKGRATDVGVVEDLMIHDLDLLLYLFKDSPTAVHSTGYKIRTDNWDYVCSEFKFKNGNRAFLVSSRNHVKEVRDMEVFSDAGCLYVDLFNNQIHLASSEGDTDGEYVETLKVSTRDHLFIEQKHFYESIDQDKPAIVGLDDGLKAVSLIDKVLESLSTGQWVDIDIKI